jgi:hypothetical protein
MSAEAFEFFDGLEDTLTEAERALNEFREYLDGLSIEDAETALEGLKEYEASRRDILMGWGKLLDD